MDIITPELLAAFFAAELDRRGLLTREAVERVASVLRHELAVREVLRAGRPPAPANPSRPAAG